MTACARHAPFDENFCRDTFAQDTLGCVTIHHRLLLKMLANSKNSLRSFSCRIGAAAKSVIRLLPAAAAQLLKRVCQAFQAMQDPQSSETPLNKQDVVSLGEAALQLTSVAFKVMSHRVCSFEICQSL